MYLVGKQSLQNEKLWKDTSTAGTICFCFRYCTCTVNVEWTCLCSTVLRSSGKYNLFSNNSTRYIITMSWIWDDAFFNSSSSFCHRQPWPQNASEAVFQRGENTVWSCLSPHNVFYLILCGLLSCGGSHLHVQVLTCTYMHLFMGPCGVPEQWEVPHKASFYLVEYQNWYPHKNFSKLIFGNNSKRGNFLSVKICCKLKCFI